MTQATTQDEDLAGTDQAATQSQPNVWEQRYNGLKGKLLEVQNQLAEAKVGFKDEREKWDTERGKWDGERQQMLEQSEQLRQALAGAETTITDLTGKWTDLSAQSETLAAQLARQQVILKYPQLVSDPVVKLVQHSSLTAEDLEATLSAMSAGQQQLVKQVYQEAQTGATQPVSPATAPASAKQEQAKETWKAALDAMQKGDMALYAQKYREYLGFVDQSGQGQLTGPRVLSRLI